MNKSLKYTCLFGGGAIRGVAYIGVIKAFEELDIVPSTLAGSSVGSIFAALLAVGYRAEELREIFSKVNFDLFRDISLGLGPVFGISKGEVFLEWVRELIEKKYYGDKYKKGTNKAVTFRDIDKNLVIITTNLANFECKEFSKQDTPDYEIASAIRISSCMPGLMRPIEYNKMLLVDGDLQKSYPMWMLSKNLLSEDERILELRLEGYYENNDISGINYANAVYSCMTAMSTSFVKDIYGKNDKFDYIVLNTGDIVVVDFSISESKRNDLIESGYKQTMNYFKNILPQKKSEIKTAYQKLMPHLIKIQKQLNSKKIVKAKITLGELFTDICEISDIMDKSDFESIKRFKDIFLSNIKYPALFGKITLSNEALINAELAQLSNKISSKIEELEKYITLVKTY